jgi:hypothetical protein
VEGLIEAIAAKTGLPADKAKDAANAALEFIKDKLPGPIAEQLEGLLSGDSAALGGLGDKLKGMFGG